MRRLLTFVVRRVKHDRTWTLDPQYSTSAFIAMLLSTAGKILRGRVRRIGFRKARGLTLMGKHVTLQNKGYISVGSRCVIEDYAVIQGLSRQGINLGDRVTIGPGVMIRPTGYYSGDIGEGLYIGHDSRIGAMGWVGCSGLVRIGSYVMIGAGVRIGAGQHNFEDTARPMTLQGNKLEPIEIGDDCWLGFNAIILAGVTIGHGSIVAAGSVVTKDVPPYSIVAGAPARIIRSRLEQPAPAQFTPSIDETHLESATFPDWIRRPH